MLGAFDGPPAESLLRVFKAVDGAAESLSLLRVLGALEGTRGSLALFCGLGCFAAALPNTGVKCSAKHTTVILHQGVQHHPVFSLHCISFMSVPAAKG